jgi:hypothetical protein
MKESLPKSTHKTILAFEEVVRRDEIVNFIKKYRGYLGIPEGGLEYTKEDEDILNHPTKRILCIALGYLPERIFPLPPEASEEQTKRFRIINTLRAVIGGQGYTSERMCSLFVFYFFFNKIYEPILHMVPGENDLIKIAHLPSQLGDYDRDDKFLLQFCFDEMINISKKYPVAIYINPEISLNEAKDYISKNWHLISEHQDKEKTLYKGKRNKPKQAINDFIYLNKDLFIGEIRSKLAVELNEFLDDGHIGKILSIERKKRT